MTSHKIPTRNWKLCSQRFSLFDRQLTFLERNSNTALSILSFILLLQGNILEIVKTKEMCFAKRNAWRTSSLEGLAFVRPHGIGWGNNEKRTHDIASIAGIYEPGNATLVSETCPSTWQLSSKIMVQFCAMISAPLWTLFDIFLISLCTGMKGDMGVYGIAVLGFFSTGISVILILMSGITVCGKRRSLTLLRYAQMENLDWTLDWTGLDWFFRGVTFLVCFFLGGGVGVYYFF